MQEAIPYKTWHQPNRSLENRSILKTTSEQPVVLSNDAKIFELKKIVDENALMILVRKGCCLGHVVKCLLQGLGANPYVYNIEENDLNVAVEELERADVGGSRGKEGPHQIQIPAVFIGGRWFGGLENVMAAHITGELTPLLKQAGALWL